MVTRLLISLLRLNASLRKRRALSVGSISSVTVVELTRLGDVLVMLSGLKRLRSTFPDAALRVIVDEKFSGLVELLMPELEVTGVEASATLRGLRKGVRAVRSKSASLLISASPARRNALVALASRAENIAGYLSHRNSFTPFLEMTPVDAFGFPAEAPEYFSRENIYVRMNRILDILGCSGEIDPSLRTPELEHRFQGGQNSRGHFPLLSERYVILFPQAGWEFREWGMERYMALARRIVAETGCAAVIAMQNPPQHSIPDAEGEARIHLLSDIPLTDIAALVRHSALVIANDSGPVHLAAALGVPTVALYGPASPELTAPGFSPSTFLYKQVECSPCDQRRCIRPGNPCMHEHTIEEVLAAVVSELREPVKHA